MENSNNYAYGPNIIFTANETERCTDALRNVSKGKLQRCRKALLEGEQSLTVLVVGESGTGKSTLINALCGEQVAEVASGPAPVSREPKRYTGRVRNVDLTFVELPDLGTDEIRARKKQLQRYCPNGVDLVYICQKLYERQRTTSIETLRRLSVVFGREIHKRAVFVMTFADNFPKNWGRGIDKKQLQANLEKDWHDHAAETRRKFQQEMHEDADKLQIMPAAYYEKGDPECSRQILNVTSDWICDLLLATVHTYMYLSATTEPRKGAALVNLVAEQANEGDTGSTPTSGYAQTHLGGINKVLSNLEQVAVKRIYPIIEEIASNFVTVCKCIMSVFSKILEKSLVASLIAIAILVVILLTIVVVAVKLVAYAVLGAVVGGATGAAVGGIVGSIVPGGGTVLGAKVGAGIGGCMGGWCTCVTLALNDD